MKGRNDRPFDEAGMQSIFVFPLKSHDSGFSPGGGGEVHEMEIRAKLKVKRTCRVYLWNKRRMVASSPHVFGDDFGEG